MTPTRPRHSWELARLQQFGGPQQQDDPTAGVPPIYLATPQQQEAVRELGRYVDWVITRQRSLFGFPAIGIT